MTTTTEQELRTAAENEAVFYPQYQQVNIAGTWRFGHVTRIVKFKGGDIDAGTPVLISTIPADSYVAAGIAGRTVTVFHTSRQGVANSSMMPGECVNVA